MLEDRFAEEHELIRVVDESGEDYLYPRTYFVLLDVPPSLERKLRKVSK